MGFIVLDGATYLLMVLILMFHYDLIHANALKMLLGVATTLVPIAMFTGHGSIRWPEGLVMSAGSVAGGFIGARLTMHERAKFWIFRILVAVLVLEIIHLGVQYVLPYIPPLSGTDTGRVPYFWRDSASASHPRRNSSEGTLDR